MPRKYKRKEGVRARVCSWTTEQLQSAFHEIDKKNMGINEISRRFGILSRTLRRRYAVKNITQLTLGNHPIFGFENEKKLVNHILKLDETGFPPDGLSIRMLAYQFAEKLKLKHHFDHESQMAGSAWLKSFIERNPELSIRQAEGFSVARAKGISREEINNFYELLTKVMTDNDLLDAPESIALQAKKKWNILRRGLINALVRRMRKKKGSLSRAMPPWKYERQMSFILPYIKFRTNCNISGYQTNEMDNMENNFKEQDRDLHDNLELGIKTENDPNEEMMDLLESETVDVDVIRIKVEKDSDWDENEDADSRFSEADVKEQNSSYMKKKANSSGITEKKLKDTRTNCKSSKKDDSISKSDEMALLQHLDSTDLFFLSMSRMTKQLPHIEQVKIKLLLGNAVLQAEIKSLEPEASNSSRDSP